MQPTNDNSINIPAFLTKLWKMVNDPGTDHLISWGPNGGSFIIQNQAQFWYDLLPLYYKHNNMSSFVRQLNMYGFHKMSSMENNGSAEMDKDEIKFYHPYFQQNKPDLMKNIKRKVTTAKNHTLVTESTNQGLMNSEDINGILSDVKSLKGRQSSVDSQLTAMKQENAVLWRELALLRQKHLKQQQIVNKLIQFLVTMVQPTRMTNLGVKRHLPLMIHESPEKKAKVCKSESTTSEGPVIHELDNADVLTDELLADASHIQEVFSPKVDSASECGKSTQSANADAIWNNSEFIMQGENLEELLSDNELQEEEPIVDEGLTTADKIFLNPATQDTLLSNLMNGNYNTNVIKDAKGASTSIKKEAESEMTVATRKEAKHKLSRLNSVTSCTDGCYSEDLDLHLENTQHELNQFKELLSCKTLDANALLGLFNDESPPYGLNYNDNPNAEATMPGTTALNQLITSTFSDPMVSGSEITPYNNPIDFSQLFDDSSEEYLNSDILLHPTTLADLQDSINTPNVNTTAPTFPTSTNKTKK